jgi:hypothetical protein
MVGVSVLAAAPCAKAKAAKRMRAKRVIVGMVVIPDFDEIRIPKALAVDHFGYSRRTRR